MSLSSYGSSNGQSDGVVLTPQWFKDIILEKYGQYFDPCPHPRPEGYDSLVIDWPLDTHIYVNPPYKRGQIGAFVKKCYEQFLRGANITLLIPSYTDTAYFHDYIYKIENVEIEFLRGRMKFIDSKTGEIFQRALPCPLMVVTYKGGQI
tara:strand:- start:1376 stop:1822 length:447 start_codon:yes stop_codon:yes gene_type:complete